MNWKPSDAWGLTLKEFCWVHDACVIDRWDHTAQVSALLDGATCATINANSSKHKVRPRTPLHFHPYKEAEVTGHKITKKNFSTLRDIANALCRR